MTYPLAGFADTVKATRPEACPYCAVWPSVPCALHRQHDAVEVIQSVRPPLRSVGLVCECGLALASIEGVATTCRRCGSVWLVTALRLGA